MRSGATHTLAISHRIQALLADFRAGGAKVDDGNKHWALFPDDKASSSTRAIIGIPTLGCSYARTSWGGCAVCGHRASMLWNAELSVDAIVRDVEKSLAGLDAARPARLCLYTSGSFLDEHELPGLARRAILGFVRRHPWVRAIAIESLPQFVNDASIAALRAELGDLEISVGMGVDTSDATIRALCFQRHIATKLYEQALQTCRTWGVETIGYVVHKPPFLTEDEAVFDTARSIGQLLEWGFDRVSIEPVALQAGTLQAHLYHRGEYDLPSFWGVVSAVAALRQRPGPSPVGRLLLGGQVFTPLPVRTLKSCAACRCKAADLLGPLGRLFEGVGEAPHGKPCGGEGIIEGQEIDEMALIARAEKMITRLRRLSG